MALQQTRDSPATTSCELQPGLDPPDRAPKIRPGLAAAALAEGPARAAASKRREDGGDAMGFRCSRMRFHSPPKHYIT